MAQDLLFEIGAQALPVAFVRDAVRRLPALLQAELGALRLDFASLWAGGSSRRVVVQVRALAAEQRGLDAEVLGPLAKVALDASGGATQTALNFASKLGVPVADLYVVKAASGDRLAARQRQTGLPAAAVLPEALQRVCMQLATYKPLGAVPRPTVLHAQLRWLLALLGDRVLPLQYDAVWSSNVSFAYVQGSWSELNISSAERYAAELAAAHVGVDVALRKAQLRQRVAQAAHSRFAAVEIAESLLEDAAYRLEDAQVSAGEFNPAGLSLPECVLREVIDQQPNTLGIYSEAGERCAGYLYLHEAGLAWQSQAVPEAAHQQLQARLATALRCYAADRASSAAELRARLDASVFHPRLGTWGDKVERVTRLSAALGQLVGLSPEQLSCVQQVAALGKLDRVTSIVREFPDLQGRVGQHYAPFWGASLSVAAALAEPLTPRAGDPALPADRVAACVALADRVDTLVACTAIHLMPMGPEDPYALRQAGVGVLQILIEQAWALPVAELVRLAYPLWTAHLLDLNEVETGRRLTGFLRHRLRGLLSKSYPAELVEACLRQATSASPYELAEAIRALAERAPA